MIYSKCKTIGYILASPFTIAHVMYQKYVIQTCKCAIGRENEK